MRSYMVMRMIRHLLFMTVILFAGVLTATASAVTVSVVPGKTVGLDDIGYFSGIVTLNIDGAEYPAVMVDWYYNNLENLGWETDYTPWEAVLYTQDEILAGANVIYSPEKYSMASKFFLDGMLGYNPADPLWTAGYNEMVWDSVSGIGFWGYADREYPEPGSGITLHDVYNTEIANGLGPNYDYSGFMGVLQTPISSQREFLVFSTISAVPVPPAVWLFGSGLFGLIGVARMKK